MSLWSQLSAAKDGVLAKTVVPLDPDLAEDWESDGEQSEPCYKDPDNQRRICACSGMILLTFLLFAAMIGILITHQLRIAAKTCIVTAAVGERYHRLVNLTGHSREGYAKKWGYRHIVHVFNTTEEFQVWCNATELGSQLSLDAENFQLTVMKNCIIAQALFEEGCRRVLFLDADAQITNWDLPITFIWPGTDHQALRGDQELMPMSHLSRDPHFMYALQATPEGVLPNGRRAPLEVPRNNSFCPAVSSGLPVGVCPDFGQFWSCMNTGVMLADDSEFSRAHILAQIRTGLSGGKRKCSSSSYNPWEADVCKLPGGDQCMVGCALLEEAEEEGENVTVPSAIRCIAHTARPAFQQILSAVGAKARNSSAELEQDTFIVNCVADQKVACVLEVMQLYPQLRDFGQSLTSAQLKLLRSDFGE